MPEFHITDAIGNIGVVFLITGAFLFIAGQGIIKVEKISVETGQRTWVTGMIIAFIGVLFLVPEVKNAYNETFVDNSEINGQSPTETILNEPTQTQISKDTRPTDIQLTNTIEPSSTSVDIQPPLDYQIFDDFENDGELDERWNIYSYGDDSDCKGSVSEGMLNIKCIGGVGEDLNVQFGPDRESENIVHGAAIAAMVESYDENLSFALIVDFVDQDGINHNRRYSINLFRDRIVVGETDVQNDWEYRQVYEDNVEPSQFQIIQIEMDNSQPIFYINGKQVELEEALDFPENSEWESWDIIVFLPVTNSEPHKLDSSIMWTAIKP